jgi:hypothetical protein
VAREEGAELAVGRPIDAAPSEIRLLAMVEMVGWKLVEAPRLGEEEHLWRDETAVGRNSFDAGAEATALWAVKLPVWYLRRNH